MPLKQFVSGVRLTASFGMCVGLGRTDTYASRDTGRLRLNGPARVHPFTHDYQKQWLVHPLPTFAVSSLCLALRHRPLLSRRGLHLWRGNLQASHASSILSSAPLRLHWLLKLLNLASNRNLTLGVVGVPSGTYNSPLIEYCPVTRLREWRSFKNSGRTDGLELGHWVKAHTDPNAGTSLSFSYSHSSIDSSPQSILLRGTTPSRRTIRTLRTSTPNSWKVKAQLLSVTPLSRHFQTLNGQKKRQITSSTLSANTTLGSTLWQTDMSSLQGHLVRWR